MPFKHLLHRSHITSHTTMRYSPSPLLFALLCLFSSACHEIQDAQVIGGPVGVITMTSSDIPLSPLEVGRSGFHAVYSVDVGPSGQQFTVIASFPEEEGVPLNDTYIVSWSDSSVPASQVSISRQAVSSYQSAYHISVMPNHTGKSYTCYLMLFDDTRVLTDGSGRHYNSRATLALRQAAE